jgi:hypothetical protein
MADFSKQWCEINDPEMPWDFDVIEEWNNLEIGYVKPMICEGFGFIAVGKLEEDPMNPKVFFRDDYDAEGGYWMNLFEVMDDERQNL